MRLAFLSNNNGSLPSLHRHASELDGIIPEWLTIETTGTVSKLDAGIDAEQTLHWMSRFAPHLSIYPQLTSSATASELAGILAGPARAQLIQEIDEYLALHELAGIVLKLTDLRESDYRLVAVFLLRLRERLASRGRKTILATAPKEVGRRLQELSRLVDYILVSTHDQSSMRSEPGPAVSQGWFEDTVWEYLSLIPAAKLIVTIGSYGTEFDHNGTRHVISVQQAWDRMERAGVQLEFDNRSLNPGFAYHDGDGHRRGVWLLDAATAFNQAKSALAIRPAGIALWRLGLEDPGVWMSIGRGRIPNELTINALTHPEPGFGGLSLLGGALVGITPGRAGARTLAYAPHLGLLTGQQMSNPPSQFKSVEWYPRDPKTVALTFDDGPDPTYTPQVLDILTEKGVKATFYILGKNALQFPELLNRIYSDGHDIGNHSYSHANLLDSSSNRIAAELNSTQRIVESEVGVRTVLFRPPYAERRYDFLERSRAIVETSSALGYLIGGYDVNAFDFLTTTDWLKRQVVEDVTGGRGQVVLLHDSGGRREVTIEALPLIIDELHAAGFRFVTTHELVGLERHEVMPPVSVSTAGQAEAGLRLRILRSVAWLAAAIPVLAISTAVFGFIRLMLIVVGAVVQKRKSRLAPPPTRFTGTTAIIVPAYNEEDVICKTISGLLSSSVEEQIEILVIDDGSTDRTTDVVNAVFAAEPRVRLFRKANGGKAAALNYGISQTNAEVIIAIDGDTILLPDAIERLTALFSDPSIGGVAGKVVVGNRINLMTRFQALEYITSQNLDRRAFELFNAIGVIPGAVGAWRREALVEAGGYSDETLAEDADLTISLERLGWKVVGESTAVALTEAPESLRSFMKQRFRWMFGTLQVAYKHAGAWLDRPSGVSMITIPNILLFQFAFTLLAPVMDALLVWTIAMGIASVVFELGASQSETVLRVLKYWLVFQTADGLAAAIGVILDGEKRNWRLIPLIILQRFSYRQLLYVTAIRALLAAIKGTLVGWGKLVRTGTVTVPFPGSHNP